MAALVEAQKRHNITYDSWSDEISLVSPEPFFSKKGAVKVASAEHAKLASPCNTVYTD